MELKKKVVVITGAGSGMGATSAKHLAKLGAKVAVLDIDGSAAEQTAKAIDGLACECNVFEEDDVLRALNKVVDQFKAIHVLINCAGIAPAGRIVGREGPMPLEDFHKTIHVNLIGTFNMMRLGAAQMYQQKVVNDDGERGVIINTASVAAFEGQIGQVAYSASKGGVVSMTLPAAREFGKFGIRVMTIAPGIMQTPMMAGMPEKVQESLAEEIVFPKRLGQAKEYAKLAQHIIENAYLNGEVIRLDGGIRMQPK